MRPENKEIFRKNDKASRSEIDPVDANVEAISPQTVLERSQKYAREALFILDNDKTLTETERQEVSLQYIDAQFNVLLINDKLSVEPEYDESGNKIDHLADLSSFIQHAIDDSPEIKNNEESLDHLITLKFKKLDVDAYIAHKKAIEAFDSNGKLDYNAYNIAGGELGGVINQSVAVMNELYPYTQNNPNLERKARGMMYELMVMTSERIKIWQNESYENTYVRSAFSREDRPHNGNVVPKRGIDMIISRSGNKEMYQLKNGVNNDDYAPEIIKVNATQFWQKLKQLPELNGAFETLISNPGDPDLQLKVRKSEKLIEDLIRTDIDKAKVEHRKNRSNLGGYATANAR